MIDPNLDLPQYRSHKRVHAMPMSRGDYNNYRGWQMPENEDPSDPGYLVVYNRNTVDHYESWSPKHVFDDGYTEIPEEESGTTKHPEFTDEQRLQWRMDLIVRYAPNENMTLATAAEEFVKAQAVLTKTEE